MIRTLHPWLLALLLLVGQHAAWVHGLSHATFDATSHSNEDGPNGPHPAAQCLVYHAVESAIPCGKVAVEPPRIQPQAPRFVDLPLWRASRIEFDSRAPPFSLS